MKRQIQGFTLMELIISIMLMAIMTGLLASIIAVNFDTLERISQRKKLITRGLLATELFRREAGSIRNTDDITVASATSFRFLDAYNNTWEYAISGSTLTRQQVGVGSAMTLAAPIIGASSVFRYIAEDNSDLGTSPTISQINRVELKLIMDDGQNGTALLSAVYPENFKVFNH